jgi:hypothetical protein
MSNAKREFEAFLNKSVVNVKVSPLVKQRLTVLQGFLQIKNRKKISLSRVIEFLLNRYNEEEYEHLLPELK